MCPPRGRAAVQQGAGHDRAGALLWALWDPTLGQDASSALGLDEMLHPVCKGGDEGAARASPRLVLLVQQEQSGAQGRA